MKKTLFLLMCTLGLLASCSQDDDLLGDSNGNLDFRDQKTRWYGVRNPETSLNRGIALESKLWQNAEEGITVKFITEPKNPNAIEFIKKHAVEWEKYANVKFKFVNSDEDADVRIAFDWKGNISLVWSYTGTDAKTVVDQNEPTAFFSEDILDLRYWSEEEGRGDVFRLFGQILGLEFEQRHQDWTFKGSMHRVKRGWEMQMKGVGVDSDWIYENIIATLSGENAIYPIGNPPLDELSIMMWPNYSLPDVGRDKYFINYKLSETDKAFIGQLYPKK